MKGGDHWEKIYTTKPVDKVSWYTPHLALSLDLLDAAKLPLNAAIIDVGGGASTLVDDLLDRGHTDVTVLDLSASAIESAKGRLGPRASAVHWIVGDITAVGLDPQRYDFWHDRAVFHFLIERQDRRSTI
ncbi:MAG: class I SAM-dependent methyltransferase [Candidatus Eisenbacteria bacterium]|nr:class I SAM-dependent methyltransferase [Candidatus Eisenbacteria bacterium]